MVASCGSSRGEAKWADKRFFFLTFLIRTPPTPQHSATYCLFSPTCTDPFWQQIWPHSLCCSNVSLPSSPVAPACMCTALISLYIFKTTVLTYFLNVGMDPCRDRPGDVPEPRLCPDSRLSVSKVNIPSGSLGMSRNSPSFHTVPKLSIDLYLISMVTLVCAQNSRSG